MYILVYDDNGKPAGKINNIVLDGVNNITEIDGVFTNPPAADVPEVPAVPDAQDVVDALLSLGLISQVQV